MPSGVIAAHGFDNPADPFHDDSGNGHHLVDDVPGAAVELYLSPATGSRMLKLRRNNTPNLIHAPAGVGYGGDGFTLLVLATAFAVDYENLNPSNTGAELQPGLYSFSESSSLRFAAYGPRAAYSGRHGWTITHNLDGCRYINDVLFQYGEYPKHYITSWSSNGNAIQYTVTVNGITRYDSVSGCGGNYTTPFATSNSALYLGVAEPLTPSPWPMALDNVILWNRALTAAEQVAVFDVFKVPEHNYGLAASADPIAWWKFTDGLMSNSVIGSQLGDLVPWLYERTIYNVAYGYVSTFDRPANCTVVADNRGEWAYVGAADSLFVSRGYIRTATFTLCHRAKFFPGAPIGTAYVTGDWAGGGDGVVNFQQVGFFLRELVCEWVVRESLFVSGSFERACL